jgi:SRSO17 transposase
VTLTWDDVWTWGGHRQQDSLLVWNKIPAAVTASHSVDVQQFSVELADAVGSTSSRFARRKPLAHAADLVLELVSPLESKNCWTIAEQDGHSSPNGLHLLVRAVWDAEAARDDVHSYVIERLADPGAVLVVDETGYLKKGTLSVGVQRQYTGTAGRVENTQVAAFLAYAAERGHTFLDRRLYLPKSWCDDAGRHEQARVPDRVVFATKPALAAAMIQAALRTSGVGCRDPPRWAAGDEVYGADPGLRGLLFDAWAWATS